MFAALAVSCIACANPAAAQATAPAAATSAAPVFLPPDQQDRADELKLSPLLRQFLGVEFGLNAGLPPFMRHFQHDSLEAAAQVDDPRACNALGAEQSADPRLAFRRTLMAAQNGSQEAMLRVANMLISGIGVERNPQLGNDWITMAARLGDGTARQIAKNQRISWQNAGPSLEQAINMKRDEAGFNAAYELALSNHPAPTYLVGVLYSQGAGVRADKAESLRWFMRAALNAHPWALFILGQAYAEGDGMPRQLPEGLIWLNLAYKYTPQPDVRAKLEAAMQQVQHDLTPDQLTAVQALLPAPEPPRNSSDNDRRSREFR